MMRLASGAMLLLAAAVVAHAQYADSPPVAAPGGDPVVVNEQGEEETLDAEVIGGLKRQKVRAKGHDGKEAEYEGVSLADALKRGGVTLGDSLRGPLMANYLLVEAADGYRVVFSLQEIDPASTDRVVVLADRRNGEPLGEKHGRYQLIVPGEKRHSRWVRGVTKLVVRRASADEGG